MLLERIAQQKNPIDDRKSEMKEENVGVKEPEETVIEEKTTEDWIRNSGLILLWPFYERLFSILDMLEDRAFKTPELAYRAVHILQFVASGKEA